MQQSWPVVVRHEDSADRHLTAQQHLEVVASNRECFLPADFVLLAMRPDELLEIAIRLRVVVTLAIAVEPVELLVRQLDYWTELAAGFPPPCWLATHFD